MAVGIIFVAAACSKNEPVYSSTPAIEFKSVVKYTLGADATQNRRDSVVVSVVFKDGDGDLGENVRDTTRLKQVFTNQTWGNYQIRTFQFINGRFEEILIAANAKLFFELANNQRGPLEGLLGFGQKFLYQSNAKLSTWTELII